MLKPQRRILNACIAFLLCTLISACSGPAVALPAPTAPQITATITPSATLTRTMEPSSTPEPSDTPTPRPSFTPTEIPPTLTATIDPQSMLTEEAWNQQATQIASFPKTCGEEGSNNNYISPQGNWLASSCGYIRDQTLEIVDHNGKQWVLPFKDYLTDEFTKDGGTPMGGLFPAQWTSDEEYLYFKSYVAIDGGGTCFYGFGDSGLFRINLNTGSVSTTLSLRSPWDGYLISFSPNGRRMVYILDQPIILDMITGEKTTLDIGDAVAGDPIWSPDGSQLAYSICQFQKDGDYVSEKKSAIIIYSLETQTVKTIMGLEKGILHIMAWDGNQQLRIANIDEKTGNDVYSFYDWSSGKIITPTPTP